MSSALPKRLKDSLATRPEIQITHTRGGRQSLAPVDINTRERKQREQETVSQNLEAIGAVGANLRPFSFGGSVETLRWSAQPW